MTAPASRLPSEQLRPGDTPEHGVQDDHNCPLGPIRLRTIIDGGGKGRWSRDPGEK
jgi:hypothetical protein